MSDAAFGIAGLVAVSLLTPGPNNLLVMTAATRRGWCGAVEAAAGVMAGSAALLLLAAAGIAPIVTARPRVATALALAGGLYLVVLGGRLMAPRRPRVARSRPRALAGSSAAGLFLFQFANPKAWITWLTAVTAAQGAVRPGAALPLLLGLLLAIGIPSLALWASCGVAITRRLEPPGARRRFDRAAGGLLVASALLLIVSIWRTV